MQRTRLLLIFIPPGFLAILLMAVYLASMAPGLTWANFGADGGDLIAAAATGGIAHPPGYPLYLLLARLFQLLPIGSLAYRTNLMSAFTTAMTAVLVYALVGKSLSYSNPEKYWMAGLASGIAFGLAPLIWSQAVITEVYALHSFLVALILLLSVIHFPVGRGLVRLDRIMGLVFGLAMGNHVTMIVLLPVVLLTTIVRVTGPEQGSPVRVFRMEYRSLIRRIVWSAVGLLVYFTLPLRALSQPPVNWGNPINWAGFMWLVSGKLYQDLVLKLEFLSVLERVQAAVALLLTQFGIVGISAGLVGLVIFFKPTRLNIGMLWITIASAAFAIGYATTDAFMYLIPAFLCFSIWIGIGLGGMMNASSQKMHAVSSLISAILIFTLLVQAWNHLPQVDASHDSRAESFGQSVLTLAPARALVFAEGDGAIFTLWYYQYALRDRPDLAIIAPDLLGFNWYLQTLQATYPDLNIPGPVAFAESLAAANPGRPNCYVQYIQAPEINCLPTSD
jgi:hypothetical protein